MRGQVQPGQNPGFNLFPSVLGEENAVALELGFNLVESASPPLLAIAVDAQYEDVHHSFLVFDDCCQLFGFKRFSNPAE